MECCAKLVELLDSPVVPVGELVIWIPAPRSDHCQNESAALAKQFLIRAGIALAYVFRHMSEVELDRPTATRLEIDEQRPALRVEQVARVRLAM
jgi:DNA-binding GntR family transcriptional regulator